MRTILFLMLPVYLAAQPVPADIQAGANMFHSHCAECHGREGEGGRGPDLTRGLFRHGSSDDALFRTISFGIPGTQMPGSYFPDNQILQIVAFVKTLSRHDAEPSLPGNRASGEKLFHQSGCAKCHMIRGAGGRLGPDLSDVGSIRSPAYLRAVIVDPNARPSVEHRAVRLVDKQNRQISGVRLNEDSYSIQMMDFQENLHSFQKRDLSKIEVSSKSPMPSFDKLPPAQLDDLAAFLSSLRLP